MEKINVMINGLPGNVTRTIATHVLADSRFELLPYALTGADIDLSTLTLAGTEIELIHPHRRDARMDDITARHDRFITVDFTHPSAVNDNADFYCRRALPFVMGTTGGDRERLVQRVRDSTICAVVAPNMAKQIVGFQAMLEYAAATFPGLFDGYSLSVRESHQAGKADTSGTAKAVVSCFNRMGVAFSPQAIVMERDPAVQRDTWNIPEAHLAGHGWHTYRLTSPDKTVVFEFQHNVNGRDIYAGGTMDAVVFLNQRLEAGQSGKVYSMIDVLKG